MEPSQRPFCRPGIVILNQMLPYSGFGKIGMLVELKEKPPIIGEGSRLDKRETGYIERDKFKGHSSPLFGKHNEGARRRYSYYDPQLLGAAVSYLSEGARKFGQCDKW